MREKNSMRKLGSTEPIENPTENPADTSPVGKLLSLLWKGHASEHATRLCLQSESRRVECPWCVYLQWVAFPAMPNEEHYIRSVVMRHFKNPTSKYLAEIEHFDVRYAPFKMIIVFET